MHRTPTTRRGLSHRTTVVVVSVLVIIACIGSGAVMGLLLGPLTQAKIEARLLKSHTHILDILKAREIYLREHPDATEVTVEVLIKDAYVNAKLLVSPVGRASDGTDYWFRETVPADANPSSLIVMYDRGAYEHALNSGDGLHSGTDVPVGYLDGRVVLMDVDQLATEAAVPPNQALAGSFPPSAGQ